MITTLEDYNKRVNEAVENDLLMFNTNLLIKEYMSVYEYFELYKDEFYKNQELEFKDEFLKLIPQKKAFCVHHEFLIKCEIIQNKNSSYIKRCLNDIHAKLDVDYCIIKTAKKYISGTKYKNNYYLTPKSFKKILMRSPKTEKYADYYLMIEDSMNAYDAYQLLYKNMLISSQNKLLLSKDAKIDNLIKMTEQLVNDNKELKNDNKELKNNTEKIIGLNVELNDKVDKMQIDIDKLINLVKLALSDRVKLINSISEDIPETKFLIMYVLKDKTKEDKNLFIALRYCEIKLISSSIAQLKKKAINKDLDIVSLYNFGPVLENVLTIQAICKKIKCINKNHKQTLDYINNDEYNNILEQIIKLFNENKDKKLKIIVNEDKELNKYENAFDEFKKQDKQFNTEIVDVLNLYLKEKLFKNVSFRSKRACKDIKDIYDDLKNN